MIREVYEAIISDDGKKVMGVLAILAAMRTMLRRFANAIPALIAGGALRQSFDDLEAARKQIWDRKNELEVQIKEQQDDYDKRLSKQEAEFNALLTHYKEELAKALERSRELEAIIIDKTIKIRDLEEQFRKIPKPRGRVPKVTP